MRLVDVESWTLRVIDLVENGNRVEDSRVELKSEWPDEVRAARRIAGHANASRGEPILWIIGLDEARGVVSFPDVELSDWTSRVKAQFDQLAPDIDPVLVPTSKGHVFSLLIDTRRAPFVIGNPAHGQPGGGPVEREVPWRDGTRTRTARREDLVRILEPYTRRPLVEVRLVELFAGNFPTGVDPKEVHDHVSEDRQAPHTHWDTRVEVYIIPRQESPLVFPRHRMAFTWTIDGLAIRPDEVEYFRSGGRMGGESSVTVEITHHEVILSGPGFLGIRASATTALIDASRSRDCSLRLEVQSTEMDAPLAVDIALSPSQEGVPSDYHYPGRPQVEFGWRFDPAGQSGSS